jgi:hypothetical protein
MPGKNVESLPAFDSVDCLVLTNQNDESIIGTDIEWAR